MYYFNLKRQRRSQVSVNVTDNSVKVKIDTKQSASLALRYILEDIQRTSEPRTPKREGNLRRNTNISVQGLSGVIAWMANYAIYQESKQYTNYTTPGTGPHFAENAVKTIVENSNSYFEKARLI